MNSRVETIIASSASLRQLPPLFQTIKDAVESPEASFEDIARIAEADAELSRRLLLLANSSFYGYPSSVSNVPDALSVIGLQQFKNMALAVSMPSIFSVDSAPSLDHRKFWRHSIAVGICARVMALERREANSERFFLAGLYNKLGRLLIADLFPDKAHAIRQRGQREAARLQSIELEELGFDCHELGAAALKRWQLPSTLVEMVRHSPKPILAKRAVPDISLIHLAAFIVESLQVGSIGERFVPEFSEAAWGYSGLEEERLPFIIEESLRQHTDVCDAFL